MRLAVLESLICCSILIGCAGSDRGGEGQACLDDGKCNQGLTCSPHTNTCCRDCCQAKAATQCDNDGNVRWFDSCGNAGEVAMACPRDNGGGCQNTSATEARCICAGNWDPAKNCTACKGHFDPATGCVANQCVHHWEGPDCDTCPGSWDPGQDCAVCKANWNPTTDCTTCIGNWDLQKDCLACVGNWDPGKDCAVCKANWDPNTDCTACIGNWDLQKDCLACVGNWDPGKDCAVCKANWDPNTDCTSCIGKWDRNKDCLGCVGNWDPAKDCALCKNHWVDSGDNCGGCPLHWDAAKDCNSCLTGWGGADCLQWACRHGRGNGTFGPQTTFSTGGRPDAVATGDFDADGILDLAVANGTANSVSILLGNGSNGVGDGSFAGKVDYPVRVLPMAVTTGDFNSDGILDLAVANSSSNSISILLGNGSAGIGDGTFASPDDYPVGVRPLAVVTRDFNADGILDLAVADYRSNSVGILLGNGSGGLGDGTFGTNLDYPTGNGPAALAVGDFNADGILDLAVANGSANSISILLGNSSGGIADGTFAAKQDFPTGTLPAALSVGDFNSDGILDLAVADSRANTVSILLGNGSGGHGDGTLGAKTDVAVGAAPQSVAIGDFNSDGIADLAVVNNGANTVGILLGNGSGGHGDGTFAPMVEVPTGTAPYAVAVGTFNSDDILDLVVANNGANTVGILLGIGDCLDSL